MGLFGYSAGMYINGIGVVKLAECDNKNNTTAAEVEIVQNSTIVN